jgi:hypothetical protein
MPARDPNAVEIFTTGVPKRPFVEVALIEAREGSSEERLFPDLRSRAAAMGCEGLVLIGSNDTTVGMTTGSGVGIGAGNNYLVSGFTETVHGYRAACVVWKDEPAPATIQAPAAPLPTPPAN